MNASDDNDGIDLSDELLLEAKSSRIVALKHSSPMLPPPQIFKKSGTPKPAASDQKLLAEPGSSLSRVERKEGKLISTPIMDPALSDKWEDEFMSLCRSVT